MRKIATFMVALCALQAQAAPSAPTGLSPEQLQKLHFAHLSVLLPSPLPAKFHVTHLTIHEQSYVIEYQGPGGCAFSVQADADGGISDRRGNGTNIPVSNELGKGTVTFAPAGPAGKLSSSFYGWYPGRQGKEAFSLVGRGLTRRETVELVESLHYRR